MIDAGQPVADRQFRGRRIVDAARQCHRRKAVAVFTIQPEKCLICGGAGTRAGAKMNAHACQQIGAVQQPRLRQRIAASGQRQLRDPIRRHTLAAIGDGCINPGGNLHRRGAFARR